MSKIGIALAGGGPLGAIYEIGACAALEEALDGLDMTRAHVYVGVSAGAFIAASLANGIRPAEMARILLGDDVEHVFNPRGLLRPAFREYVERARQVPKLVSDSVLQHLTRPWRQGVAESFDRLSRALPTGFFDGKGIDALLRKLFAEPGRSNDFRQLGRRLFLVATDLDSGQAVALGGPGYDDVPISTAVQASAALPGLFPPVEIKGRHYVDGALIKTLHASVALREGAELLLCVNPLVPFNAVAAAEREGGPARKLKDGGLPVVLSQTFRAIIHSRMRVGMDRYQHEFKNADVLLFEPTQDDAEMFFANMLSYGERNRLCEHAYQRTREDLYRRRDELAPLLRRHGLELNLDVLQDRRRTLIETKPGEPRKPTRPTIEALQDALDELQKQIGPLRPA